MSENKEKWVARAMIVGAVAALSGVVVGIAFGGLIDITRKVTWWELMTAFGTVGAVIVALAISLLDARERKRARLQLAVIIGWIIAPELGALSANLSVALTLLSRIKEAKNGEKLNSIYIESLGRVALELQVSACKGVLDKLHSMPYGKSYSVAAVIGKTPSLQANLLWFSNCGIPMSELTKKQIDGYEDLIQGILLNLKEAGYS